MIYPATRVTRVESKSTLYRVFYLQILDTHSKVFERRAIKTSIFQKPSSLRLDTWLERELALLPPDQLSRFKHLVRVAVHLETLNRDSNSLKLALQSLRDGGEIVELTVSRTFSLNFKTYAHVLKDAMERNFKFEKFADDDELLESYRRISIARLVDVMKRKSAHVEACLTIIAALKEIDVFSDVLVDLLSPREHELTS